MPLLAYCLTEALPVQAPTHGVTDSGVEVLTEHGLQCFFSRAADAQQILSLPTKGAALAFHAVVQAIFTQTAVIAFRFPTILETETELGGYIFHHKDALREALGRLRDMVQMEVQLSCSGEKGVINHGGNSSQRRGTEYLEARSMQQRELTDSAVQFRDLGNDLIRDWRQRTSGRGLRCFALVERRRTEEFKAQAAGLVLSAEVHARVSGPWPASEFVERS